LRFRLSEVEAWLAQHRRGASQAEVANNGVEVSTPSIRE
jgi:hypothetical protein